LCVYAASGAWPLGIGGSEKAKLETTVDEYEALKEEDLNKRIQVLIDQYAR
jgi:hypothetical protein